MPGDTRLKIPGKGELLSIQEGENVRLSNWKNKPEPFWRGPCSVNKILNNLSLLIQKARAHPFVVYQELVHRLIIEIKGKETLKMINQPSQRNAEEDLEVPYQVPVAYNGRPILETELLGCPLDLTPLQSSTDSPSTKNRSNIDYMKPALTDNLDLATSDVSITEYKT